MKITHVAIACFYIEGWAYQENILPKFHKLLGLDVSIITSRFDKDEKNNPKLRNAGEYINNDGIAVNVLDYAKKKVFHKCIRAQPIQGLFNKLTEIAPDIIFIHGSQFYSIFDIIKYKKKHPNVKIYADQHGDYYNMPVNSFKEKIIQKIICATYARNIAKYTEMFWGVTPWRVHYLQNIYKIKPEKTGLLVMGGDDTKIDFVNQEIIKIKLREDIGVSNNDFMIVTGGKIDTTKNILLLMKAITKLDISNVKLIIFGIPDNITKEEYNRLLSMNNNIISLGWIESSEVYNWFLSADLVVFPGTHSVLWEQAVACGTPAIFKDWDGMHHVDTGGNCKFLKEDSVNEIVEIISEIYSNKILYNEMKKVAMENKENFLYSKIARKSIKI